MRLVHLMALLDTANHNLVDNVMMISMLESPDRDAARVDMEPVLLCAATFSQKEAVQSAAAPGPVAPQGPKPFLARLNTFRQGSGKMTSSRKSNTAKVHDEAVRGEEVGKPSHLSVLASPINALRRATTFGSLFNKSMNLRASGASEDHFQKTSEWQAARQALLPDKPPPLRPFKPEGSKLSTPILEEEKRKKVKDVICLLDNLWKSVSMGATTVPVRTRTYVYVCSKEDVVKRM